MEIKEIQKQSREIIDKIDSKYGKKHDVETTFIHLIEEIGEISRQLYNSKIGRDKLDKENMSEEIADCIILLSKLADSYNIDLEKAITNKIRQLNERFGVQ